MKIAMQRSATESGLGHGRWQLGIVGLAVDERGTAAIQFTGQHCDKIISLQYNAESFEILLDGRQHNAEDLDDLLSPFMGGAVLLESTSLGFVEIFLCCRALLELSVSRVDLVYVEPEEYANPRRVEILNRRDFELSKDVPGYRAIPKATKLLSDREPQHVIFFLGYEERRLEVALEDYQMIGPASCSLVFGVPAFKPGWEMNSFANNVRVIRDKNLSGGIHFCGAENPAATIQVLEEIRRSIRPSERLFVAPIGTKPNGIGVALFASQDQECGILYDHPVRSKKRTSKVSRWHLFEVEF
jgi:hypothetical protein